MTKRRETEARRLLASAWTSGSVRSFGARLAVLPVIALVGLIGSRIVIAQLGDGGFAVYGLVIGLAALLPFADLGLGAAVTDAVARRAELGPGQVRSVVRRSRTLLVWASAVVAIVSWLFAALGLWGTILGVSGYPDVNLAVGIALTIFAVSLPMSLSARALLGAERNHWVVASQAVAGLTAFAVILLSAATDAGVWAYSSAPFIGMLAAGAVNTWWARGLIPTSPAKPPAAAETTAPSLASMAGPMLVIGVSLPIAWQTDRLVLSQVSTLTQVSLYVLTFQLFSPLNSLVETAGNSLWPVFAKRRSESRTTARDVIRLTAAYGAVGVVLGTALVIVGPPLARWISKGAIQPSTWLFFAFAALMIAMATWYPTAMLLTSPSGLRFQAYCCAVMAAVNVPLSLLLAKSWGAPGPVVASVIALTLCVTAPGWLFAPRMLSAEVRQP